MDEVQELIERLNYIADEQERFTPQNGRLLLPSEIAEIRQAAKALTVSPEKLEACANAIQRTDLTTMRGVDRNEQYTDPLSLARAAALALGLRLSDDAQQGISSA